MTATELAWSSVPVGDNPSIVARYAGVSRSASRAASEDGDSRPAGCVSHSATNQAASRAGSDRTSGGLGSSGDGGGSSATSGSDGSCVPGSTVGVGLDRRCVAATGCAAA